MSEGCGDDYENGSVQRVDTVVPIGEIGDGSVQVRYTPNPAHNRSKFEIEWDWGQDIDRVYLGDEDNVRDLIATLEEMIDGE